LRHDGATHRTCQIWRKFAEPFAGDLRAAVLSVVEIALADEDFRHPLTAAGEGFDEGDDEQLNR
jgi:hypothetical protein